MFSKMFLADTIAVLSRLDLDDIERVVSVLKTTRDSGGRLFLCGSGGGAGHASHATCDFRKLCGFEAYCVSDNVSELTARVNDDGWETSYSNWLLSSRIRSKDCLFVFSVGGGSIEPPVSVNLVTAVQLALEVGAKVVGIVGRDGGILRQLSTASIHVRPVDASLVTPQTEGLQALLWHLIVSHPEMLVSEAKWEGIDRVSTSK